MKAAAIILLVLCLAALGGVGWLYLTASVDVIPAEVIATDAVSQTDYYADLMAQLENESFVGTRFSRDPLESPEQDVFYTYTVRITNRSFLPLQLAELQVSPISGDYLQVGDLEPHDLAAGRSLDLSATILTRKQTHNVRELTVSYYIWGLPFFTRLSSQ